MRTIFARISAFVEIYDEIVFQAKPRAKADLDLIDQRFSRSSATKDD
jgi:hypothetical protein